MQVFQSAFCFVAVTQAYFWVVFRIPRMERNGFELQRRFQIHCADHIPIHMTAHVAHATGSAYTPNDKVHHRHQRERKCWTHMILTWRLSFSSQSSSTWISRSSSACRSLPGSSTIANWRSFTARDRVAAEGTGVGAIFAAGDPIRTVVGVAILTGRPNRQTDVCFVVQ